MWYAFAIATFFLLCTHDSDFVVFSVEQIMLSWSKYFCSLGMQKNTQMDMLSALGWCLTGEKSDEFCCA